MSQKKVPVSTYRGVGGFLIFFGTALIITSICDIVFSTCNQSIHYVSSGIWSGMFIVTAGGIAVSINKNSTHCAFSTQLTFSILATILAIGPLVQGMIGLSLFLDDDSDYVLSENPYIECKGNYTTPYYLYCGYSSCCDCNYFSNGFNYNYTFHFDFEGEAAGIIINSILAGLGLASFITSIISCTIFCQSTTCCPSSKNSPAFNNAQYDASRMELNVQGQPIGYIIQTPQGLQHLPLQPNFSYLNPTMVSSTTSMQQAAMSN